MPRDDLLSIGQVSTATGIGVDTLRAWERRYGRPEPIRLPSGHRRYRRKELERLRLAASALELGRRPSDVLALELDELREIVAAAKTGVPRDKTLDRWIEMIRSLEAAGLRLDLGRELEGRGLERFVEELVVPFMAELGELWHDGQLEIRHKHLASEILDDVLREARGTIHVSVRAPLAIVGTLEGEPHGLGVHVAALSLLQAGVRVLPLGTNLPVEELVKAAVEAKAAAVALSISRATGSVESERDLTSLRDSLPRSLRVIAGGHGARRLRRGVRGVDYFSSLASFRKWLATKPLHKSR